MGSSSIIVEPNEDEEERQTSDRFFINLIDDNITYEIGTKVKITYEGSIKESSPAQVKTIKVEIVKE